jgi:hypothetical protein
MVNSSIQLSEAGQGSCAHPNDEILILKQKKKVGKAVHKRGFTQTYLKTIVRRIVPIQIGQCSTSPIFWGRKIFQSYKKKCQSMSTHVSITQCLPSRRSPSGLRKRMFLSEGHAIPVFKTGTFVLRTCE